jgi:hypothetical protein
MQVCKNPRRQVANIYGYSALDLSYATVLAPEILRRLLESCKICEPLVQCIKSKKINTKFWVQDGPHLLACF